MTARHRRRIRKRALGIILFVLGVLLWVITATLPLTPFYDRLVSLGNIEPLSLGVVAGGAFMVAGIIRIATSAETYGRYVPLTGPCGRLLGVAADRMAKPELSATIGMTQRSSRVPSAKSTPGAGNIVEQPQKQDQQNSPQEQ
jgi:hypothetical protein